MTIPRFQFRIPTAIALTLYLSVFCYENVLTYLDSKCLGWPLRIHQAEYAEPNNKMFNKYDIAEETKDWREGTDFPPPFAFFSFRNLVIDLISLICGGFAVVFPVEYYMRQKKLFHKGA